MPKEWTDEEIMEQINNAVQIVREDRFETFVRGRLSTPNDPNSSTGTPPPPGGNPNPPKPKKSLWWGETEPQS